MDFMSILGRCLLLPFPVAMFVGCLSWYITKPKPQKAEVA
ncbi:hypothetical protein CFSAN002058_17705 [Salmonella enterica subsp. enterica serovar Heidelberg str. CFSAN002058]|nr:hypothetical protein CFSAN002069_23645 [Salmonella enterica subsp. enterica serovar Heidelberg str. CFSAN002069]AHB93326.1 hypothetical protein CFSAN002064_00100 [Salmonella enterica subsp. enterica serovar Heidelberg str. CFSAN002064]EDZ23059.1 hypothetical protein SeHB_A4831 [Salmonella enterica subsp. enterica serovar Heidelberg str. SL486]EJI08538.1 hypothetical protein SEEE3076_13897 [Salmonella enterica subsp. enterica serovar Enteritidis str. 607307-6]EJW25366.1 hypothetical protein C